MRVKTKSKEQIPFSELSAGDAFNWQCGTYIKIQEVYDYNAVALVDGESIQLLGSEPIYPLDAEVVIHG